MKPVLYHVASRVSDNARPHSYHHVSPHWLNGFIGGMYGGGKFAAPDAVVEVVDHANNMRFRFKPLHMLGKAVKPVSFLTAERIIA